VERRNHASHANYLAMLSDDYKLSLFNLSRVK
jgi:hypothetical protein